MRKCILSLLLVCLLVLSACSGAPLSEHELRALAAQLQTLQPTEIPLPSTEDPTATNTPPAPTETPLPTATTSPQPTNTPLPVVPSVTIDANLNVRTGPSTDHAVIGALPVGSTAEIVGRNHDGSWWQILYLEGADGQAWISAGYGAAQYTESIPITAFPAPATPTPAGPAALDHFQQGMNHFDQKNWALAIAKFQTVIRLEPDSALPYLYLGLSYYLSDSEANEKAIEPLETYLQLAPEAEDREQIVALIEEIRTGQGRHQTPLGQPVDALPDKGVLVVTNYTGELVILDISGQTHEIPGKDTTPEGGEAIVILSPGHHLAIAHAWDGRAAGDVEFDIEAGQILEWPLYYDP